MTSPPALVASEPQVARLTLSLTNLTEPSRKPTFTRPGDTSWRRSWSRPTRHILGIRLVLVGVDARLLVRRLDVAVAAADAAAAVAPGVAFGVEGVATFVVAWQVAPSGCRMAASRPHPAGTAGVVVQVKCVDHIDLPGGRRRPGALALWSTRCASRCSKSRP